MRKIVLWFSLLISIPASVTAIAGPAWKKNGVAIPVVAEGSACNSASDKLGITSGNTIVTCQSGVWKASGSASRGMAIYSTSAVIVPSGNAWRYPDPPVNNPSCTCATGELTTKNYCTFNSWQMNGNNHWECVYIAYLNPVGYLAQ